MTTPDTDARVVWVFEVDKGRMGYWVRVHSTFVGVPDGQLAPPRLGLPMTFGRVWAASRRSADRRGRRLAAIENRAGSTTAACNECQLSAFPSAPDPRCPCSVIEALKEPDEEEADRAARWDRYVARAGYEQSREGAE